MITVGCAGFAVPATRYFKEHLFVEVQETHLATPGPGTVRRWRREAPPGFDFALLAPREVSLEGFRPGKIVEAALEKVAGVASELRAQTIVFAAPADFPNNRNNRAALKEFLKAVCAHYQRVVFEPGQAWKPDDADGIAEEAGALAARDPLTQGISSRREAYYRLPGPAGHKSRYEDPAIEKLADIANGAPDQEATWVFTNVDMFTDAKRLRKAVGGKNIR